MNAAEIIERLKSMEPELREAGLGALYLFGSRARGDHRPDSDIDLAFEVGDDAGETFSIWDQAGLMVRLSDALRVKVDLVERFSMRPRIRAHVEPDLMKIF